MFSDGIFAKSTVSKSFPTIISLNSDSTNAIPDAAIKLSIYFAMLGIKMKLVINVCCIAKSYISLRKIS